MARHVHADLMIAKANDSSLEIEAALKRPGELVWVYCKHPAWADNCHYRIKPKLPVVNVFYGIAAMDAGPPCPAASVKFLGPHNLLLENNIMLTFSDGKLIGAEVIK